MPSRILNEGDRSGAGAGAPRASPVRRVRMVVIARLKGRSTRGSVGDVADGISRNNPKSANMGVPTVAFAKDRPIESNLPITPGWCELDGVSPNDGETNCVGQQFP